MDIRPHRRIVLPLDVPDAFTAVETAAALHEHVGVIKFGLQLFTSEGPSLLSMGREMGLDVFLDLKLHDIPNTVAKAVESAAKHGVQFLTVHASGGRKMLEAAAKAAPPGMTILAVTVLTSLTARDLREMNVDGDGACSDEELPGTHVRCLAKMAWESGVRGFVCSPLEVASLRADLGPEAVLVVPGVRPAGSDTGDQARIATPADAVKSGASYIVVGRPILDAKDPVKAAREIAEEIRPHT